jgi:hypothetical protein
LPATIGQWARAGTSSSPAARPVTVATAAAPHRSARTCIRAFPTYAPTTQALTDGEIRYIIANGIQLTGMPAMPSLNGQEEQVSWALVTYLRSLARRDAR